MLHARHLHNPNLSHIATPTRYATGYRKRKLEIHYDNLKTTTFKREVIRW